jgi:tetratricopeptide (TPR) repeat protein
MIVEPGDRIAPKPKSAAGFAPRLALGLFVVAGLALLAVPSWRESAERTALDAGALIGLEAAQDRYAPVYKRLGVETLPPDIFGLPGVTGHLDRLAQEPCDRNAIFELAQKLVAGHEQRIAAQAYFGFAATCPNSQTEERRSASLFFEVGDLKKAIAIADDLVVKNPAVADYRYVRAKALASAGRNEDALADYKAAIELTRNRRDLGEWVFTEMADVFMALGQPCDAGASIAAWIAIDPVNRNTLREQKLRDEFLARGCSRGASVVKDL